MDEESKSKKLGMERSVTRRDFLNGVALGVGGSLLGAAVRPEDLLAAGVLDEFAPERAPDYYPPALLGMRGNHDGTYTYAHRLRDGAAPDSFGAAEDTKEHYDLVVVKSASRPRSFIVPTTRSCIQKWARQPFSIRKLWEKTAWSTA
jgi:spermidine dehydrogenase